MRSELEIGTIETLALRDVWPKEDADFTPWLKDHLDELDNTLGLGLTNARREVRAGAFRIDIVAETDFGDIVIENQYGSSNHRHLGQLVTYISHRDVQRAIWVVEEGRQEHVKAVEMLNERGFGQVWMVTVRAVRIGDSAPAPLFSIVAEPPEIENTIVTNGEDPSPREIKMRDFMVALIAQARDEGIDSPFKNITPSINGILRTHARGRNLVYRVAVNRKGSRIVITNRRRKWLGALDILAANRAEIDRAFESADLPDALQWSDHVTAGRWAIRYVVDINYEDMDYDGEIHVKKMRELNRASAEMKRVFQGYVDQLDPQLEEDVSEQI